jgi:UDP-N-acetylmuramoyl-L-alanyl-D-glutamate--2,6-diaminopimelate ligase
MIVLYDIFLILARFLCIIVRDMIKWIKQFIPEQWLKVLRPWYHGLMAWDASIYYERPSEKLVVIGITGTAGKSTTTHMLAHILNSAGLRTGYITTVNFFDGKQDFLNKHGLSMPNEILLQRQLRSMVQNKCRFAIVECTSEGLAQNRHLGINFDVALFTNLSRAHLEAHGSFGNYQQAKAKLFMATARGRRKKFFPKKMSGLNLDDPMAGYFIGFKVDEKFGVTFKNLQVRDVEVVYRARLAGDNSSANFEFDGQPLHLSVLGDFNAQNAGLATACANMLGVELPQCAAALKTFRGVRGRMEPVETGRPFQVIVDYGCEPASIRAAVEAAAQLPHNRLIHVFGSTGGHRDKAKRFEFGKTSAQFADYIIVTNDDVYDSDPQEIANNIVEGIGSFKLRQPPHEVVLDRRAAISRALSIAKKDDIVLITGKGSEQFLVLPSNKRIEWDDCTTVREELNKVEQK